ncbi:MAG TPA: hypothetical protein VF668_11505 [Pyrinomonadaceae bacterium]|jgi:DNA-directed RNA polymerase subunit RPC12/RpoP
MKAFNCPQCAAALEFERIEAPWVRCHYCNSMVVVPAELRPAPPPAREEPRTSSGAGSPALKVALAVAAFVLLAVLFGLFAALRGAPKTEPLGLGPVGGLRATPTPAPTPRPAPKPAGYEVAYTIGGEGTGPGLFEGGMAVAVDAAGRVYVSDETRRVQRFDPAGKFINTWSIPTETKWYKKARRGPTKIIVNERDEVYAVLAGVILKLAGETGEVLGAAHGSDYIHDAALAPGLGLYVVSQKGEGDDELVLIGGDGRAARRTHRFVSSQLDGPLEVRALRVAAGAGGDAYALYCIGGVSGTFGYDDDDIAVHRFTPEGKYVARFGGGRRRGEPGQFGPPSAIAADPRGRVYVCETFNAIHVYEPDGRFVRTLKAPHAVQALTFDARGGLYVAGDHKVSKLALDD